MWNRLKRAFCQRYLDVLASVYIYNEHRGYTSLDRVLEAVCARCADNSAFIAEVQKHRADERKHYMMFKRYYELRGTLPLSVDRTCGHIDRFIERIFGCTIDDLDTDAVIVRPELFEQLCRVIMLTEQRGMKQVEILLRNRIVRSDPTLVRIFKIIERDEPSHWMPYHGWLVAQDKLTATWRERMTDFWIHKSLMLAKLPSLFVNTATPRMARWPDADEVVLA
ncbi:MAG: ferritin-like domain-containing protein [Sphingomonadales bacterium]|nr:ferritin-like domain-containing protein [Sphingomonadales bacterium]